MQGDSELLWSLEPNRRFQTGNDVTEINEIGLREKLLPSKQKKSNEKRILVTGDSSIYGWGVQDHQTYAVQLEKTSVCSKSPLKSSTLGSDIHKQP